MKYMVYETMNVKSVIDGHNKIYVGVHKTEDPDKFDGYLGDGVKVSQASTFMYPKSPFQCDVKKYGVSSFERRVLYVCDTLKEAYTKEAEIVDEEFVSRPYVYNITSRVNRGPIYQFNLNGKLLKKWAIPEDVYDFYGLPRERFDLIISSKISLFKYFWTNTPKINLGEYSDEIPAHIIYLLNNDGKFIKLFIDLQHCADYLGVEWKVVSEAVKWQWLVLDKYYVTNKMTGEFKPKPRRNYIKRTFYVYNEDGSFVGKFFGKEIMKAIDLHSWTKISKIFSNNNGWYKKFFLSLEEVREIPVRKKVIMSFEVYNLQGDLIETIDSIKKLKEKYNIPNAKIKSIQKGNKYFGNYIFKYNSK